MSWAISRAGRQVSSDMRSEEEVSLACGTYGARGCDYWTAATERRGFSVRDAWIGTRLFAVRFVSHCFRYLRDTEVSFEKNMPARPLSSAQIISPVPSMICVVAGKTKRNGTC